MADRSPEPADEREWTVRWEYPVRKHVIVGPVDGRQMEGLIVVPKSRLDAAMAAADERERELQEGLDQAVRMANDLGGEVRALTAELEIVGNFLAAGRFTPERVAILKRRVDAVLPALPLPVPVEPEPEEENDA